MKKSNSENVAEKSDVASDPASSNGNQTGSLINGLDSEVLSKILEGALASISDGIGIWNSDDQLVACNDNFRSMFSHFPDIKFGKTIGNFLLDFAKTGAIPEITGKEEEWVEERLLERREGIGQEFFYQTHDGKWISRIDKAMPCGGLISIRKDVTEEKQREEQVTVQEADLELTFAAMNDLTSAVLVRDRDLKYRIANRAFGTMYGKSLDDIIGKDAVELFGAEAAAKFDPGNLETIETGKPYQIEETLTFPDGREVLCLTDVKQVTSGAGEKFACITITDISELRERETTLAEKSNKLALTSASLENLNSAVLVKDKNLRYVLVNSAFCDILGEPEKKLIGRTTLDIFGEMRSKEYDNRELMVLETGKSIEFEETFIHANGNEVTAITSIQRVVNKDGEPFVCVTVNDVTELAKLNSDLELNKERFKAFAETNSDWFWEMDKDLRFSFFSGTFQEVTGVAPAKLLGKTRRETGVPGISEEEFQSHLEVLDTRKSFRDFIHSRTLEDGKTIWLSINGIPLFDGHGNFQGYQGSGKDVTNQVLQQKQLEQAQAEAQQADRAKSEFLANMSHEIRTPMNGVMGMAELLARTELDAKQKMFTDVIVKSGASLLTIINDILDFSKLDAGQMELDSAPFRLAEAIEDVATLVSSRVSEKDLELIVRIDPALPEQMVGDVGRVRQIVTNLIGNAVKFTEQGHVFVNVMPAPDAATKLDYKRLRFEVEDTGIGIPEEKCAAVFEKFSQVDTSSSRKHEGTGLGLTIASSLVEIMGGKIGVESEVGKGSKFWFEIELPAHSEVGARKRTPMDVTGARILIVDDNVVNRSILTEQMTAWQFDSAAAKSAEEALAVMRAAKAHNINIDCVVLDYHMPEMNGGDVVKIMRADPQLADISVIMLTSVDQTEDGHVFSSLGIQRHLTKPARSSHLLETIISVLEENKFGNSSSHPIEAAVDTVKSQAEEQITAPQKTLSDASDLDLVENQVEVLVCEDNEVNQIVFTQILESAGYNYRIAPNGKVGVEMAAKLKPELILMDVSMPEMNGLQATAAIREMEKGLKRHTPIIGVTAHAIKGDMEKCIAAGMDDYLSKPVSPDALQGKISQWMKTVRKMRKA